MAPTKVIIVGAGIAGPLLAVFLKQKGYDPVLYERTESVSNAGLSLCLQANGLRVIGKSPGLIGRLHGWSIDNMLFYSDLSEDSGVIAENDVPKRLRSKFGPTFFGIRRPVVLQALIDHAEYSGVLTKWGHKLVSLEQGENSVKVRFANGAEDTASFVVGCDGLHSNTRVCLFGESPANFTGLTQWGGISPIPDQLRHRSAFMNIFGNGIHMIAYQVSDNTISWAVNMREPEAKEEWKSIDPAVAEDFKKNSPFSEWPFGAGELVRNSLKIVRYGIYDRPELKTWFQGRVVLVGDAAHPTNPHLGQGANQSYEDLGLLIDLLEKHNPSAASPSTDTLKTIFAEFERARLSLTAHLVKKARIQGEMRVVTGAEECIKRNDFYRDMCADPAKLKARFGV
ncbi:uncharacterized protein PHACADRAFT_145505 [Phanerochaete carnosa HHB-10118-sp]|uniref:FAD-binding domain-containing protein n=1 Tax=Phanerochaete carnosa (strain HHB-10118-sp) TaxID=650164 RepID=K5W4V0_PHACS|nr:uncharacterized protein PHACADRAFT_145505 [Phanerochaete carnosa HHB-10118-sp]EKM53969.1 hypothetical protein PHACADRAFT_145505 [Phanerochaete carnosa HHB-10118-sp]